MRGRDRSKISNAHRNLDGQNICGDAMYASMKLARQGSASTGWRRCGSVIESGRWRWVTGGAVLGGRSGGGRCGALWWRCWGGYRWLVGGGLRAAWRWWLDAVAIATNQGNSATATLGKAYAMRLDSNKRCDRAERFHSDARRFD